MTSLIWWTWVWSPRSWWWTGKLGVLQSIESQRVGFKWVTELNWTELNYTDCLFMVILIENWTYCFLQRQHNSVWPHKYLFLNICISEFLDNWITYSVNKSLHIWRDELNNSFMLILVFVKSSCIILKIALAIQGSCVSIQKYTFFFCSNSVRKCHWLFDRNSTESIDCFG